MEDTRCRVSYAGLRVSSSSRTAPWYRSAAWIGDGLDSRWGRRTRCRIQTAQPSLEDEYAGGPFHQVQPAAEVLPGLRAAICLAQEVGAGLGSGQDLLGALQRRSAPQAQCFRMKTCCRQAPSAGLGSCSEKPARILTTRCRPVRVHRGKPPRSPDIRRAAHRRTDARLRTCSSFVDCRRVDSRAGPGNPNKGR
jgi:hypothetical protein